MRGLLWNHIGERILPVYRFTISRSGFWLPTLFSTLQHGILIRRVQTYNALYQCYSYVLHSLDLQQNTILSTVAIAVSDFFINQVLHTALSHSCLRSITGPREVKNCNCNILNILTCAHARSRANLRTESHRSWHFEEDPAPPGKSEPANRSRRYRPSNSRTWTRRSCPLATMWCFFQLPRPQRSLETFRFSL